MGNNEDQGLTCWNNRNKAFYAIVLITFLILTYNFGFEHPHLIFSLALGILAITILVLLNHIRKK